jgi:hypothetical protein
VASFASGHVQGPFQVNFSDTYLTLPKVSREVRSCLVCDLIQGFA